MYLLGLFVSAQFAATKDPADLDDLDFFPFPTLGTAVRRRGRARRPDRHAGRSRPSRRTSRPRPTRPRRTSSSGRRARPSCIMFQNQPGLIPTAKDADTSTLQRRSRRRPSRSSAKATADHPVPRPRHPLGLRRRERHAGLPADVPRRTRPRTSRPTRRPSRTSGTRCRRCPEPIGRPTRIGYPDRMADRAVDAVAAPPDPADRRGGRTLAPCAAARSRPATASPSTC